MKSTYEGLLNLGNSALQKDSYDEAIEYYKLATKKAPQRSEAWYYMAKAELRKSGVKLSELVAELQSGDPNKLPFFPTKTLDTVTVIRTVTYRTEAGANALYSVYAIDTLYDKLVKLIQPCFKAYDNMVHIFDGRAPEGTFKEPNIRLDFTMLSSLRTALVSLDMNRDGSLDPELNPYNKERKLYKIMGKGLTDINDINIDVNSIKSMYAGPDDINGMIDSLVASAAISLSAITNLDAEIQASSAAGVDKEMMADPKKQMQSIIAKANYYKYSDHKDNDSDWYDTNHDGLVQRTIWIDTNGNDGIDWVDPSSGLSYNLTDLFSRLRRDTANNPQPTSGMAPPWVDTAAHLYDSAYFHYRKTADDKFYIFKKGNGGEFVAGDWGVDEEQLDDKLNDGDGIKEEDSRVASDTLDSDNDFIDVDTLGINDSVTAGGDHFHGSGKKCIIPTNPYFGKGTSRMIWADLNGNGRIDGPSGPLTYAIVAANRAAIMASINGGVPYGEWIAADWGADEEYVDGLDNAGDGRVDEDGDLHLIHRSEYWSAVNRNAYMNYVKANILPANILGVR